MSERDAMFLRIIINAALSGGDKAQSKAIALMAKYEDREEPAKSGDYAPFAAQGTLWPEGRIDSR
jgi:hypothetical protein